MSTIAGFHCNATCSYFPDPPSHPLHTPNAKRHGIRDRGRYTRQPTSPLTIADGQQSDASYAGGELELLREEVEGRHEEVVSLQGEVG